MAQARPSVYRRLRKWEEGKARTGWSTSLSVDFFHLTMSTQSHLSSTRPSRARRRRILMVLAGLIVLAFGSLPWWLPAVIVGVASRLDVSVGSWRSVGWSRVEYRDVVIERPGVRVHVDSARVPRFLVVPRGRPEAEESAPIEIGHVGIVLSAQPERPEKAAPAVSEILRQVAAGWRKAQRWLPEARVAQVVLQSEALSLELHDIRWEGAEVRGAVRMPDRGIAATLEMAANADGDFEIAVAAPERDLSMQSTVAAEPDGESRLAGTVLWRDMPVTLRARFGPEGLLPVEASVQAGALSVPADMLGLTGYAPLTGSVQAAWVEREYTVEINAQAEPLAESAWPRATVQLRAAGTTESVRIDSLQVQLPAVNAALSRPVDVPLDGSLPGTPAEFSLDLDLASVPGLDARGTISGSAVVRPGDDGRGEVAFTVSGEEVGWRDLEDAQLSVEGTWRQTQLILDQATLTAGSDATARASFAYDTQQSVLRRAELQAVLPGGVLGALARGMPPCQRVELSAEAQGSLLRLEHRAVVAFTGLEWTKGRLLDGSLRWSGSGAALTIDGQLELPGGGSLPFACSAQRQSDGSLSGMVNHVRWVDAEGEWWRLEQPVAASYDPVNGEIHVAPWRLRGPEFLLAGEARVRGPARGEVSLVATNMEGRRFGGVLPEGIRGGRLEQMNLQARWDHGPAAVEGDLRAVYSPVKDTAYAVEGEFRTSDGGIAFGSIQVQDASGVVLRGVGRLPLLIEGTEAGFKIALLRDEPIALELDSEPNPVFWKSIADLTGWTVEEPRLQCRLGGSIAAPQGEIELTAAGLRAPESMLANGGHLPKLSDLRLRLVAEESGVSLTGARVAIDNQWVTIAGRAPWTLWRRWSEAGQLDWRSAQFELATNPLPIAVASQVFPTQLASEGEVSIRIAHAPEQGFSGHIWLHDASTRPLGPLGPVRDISSQLDLRGYTIELTQLEGYLGGQPVRVSGEADLADPARAQFAAHVKSSRVPLVRKSGLIVRTEVDLDLKQGAEGPARVTGRIDFGPSLYSSDLLALLPSGVDRPESRPPYFSVEGKPFSEWQLDVAAHGEAFLRVNTPFFKDLLSTDVRLTGTLGEPRVEGWVWGTGGVVTFPFGRIPVEQVLVTLSREDPYQPQLMVSGAGRVLGYDIRMEAAGPASEPRLLFTSDPPLTSQQVFMMLTTGAIPGDEHSIGTSDRASRLALFLGRNLAAGLGIGGSYGGDERLEIRSGEDFTRAGRETIIVQYDIDGRWSLVGEYDRFDEYNGGIKFRIIDR